MYNQRSIASPEAASAVEEEKPKAGGEVYTAESCVIHWSCKTDDKKKACELSTENKVNGMQTKDMKEQRYSGNPADPAWYGIFASDPMDGTTEDDVLHKEALDDFDGNLSREDSEALFSYLTVPYLRVPLVIEFFAKGEDRLYFFIYLFYITMYRGPCTCQGGGVS